MFNLYQPSISNSSESTPNMDRQSNASNNISLTTFDSKKRKRSSKACIICHQRKIKCDLDSKGDHERCSNCDELNLRCELYKRKKRIKKYQIQENLKLLLDKTNLQKVNNLKLDSNLILESYVLNNDQNVEHILNILNLTNNENHLIKKLLSKLENDKLNANDSGQSMVNKLDENDVEYLTNVGCFNLPSVDLCKIYIDDFFAKIYPRLPIIDKKDFLNSHTDLSNPPSLLLLQSILTAASRVITEALPNDEQRLSQANITAILYKKSKLLYKYGFEKNPIKVIQSLTFIQLSDIAEHESEEISFYFWSEFSKIHIDSLNEVDVRIVRKIYWFWKTRDNFQKFVLNKPLFLQYESFIRIENFPNLCIDDFKFDEDLPDLSKNGIAELYKSQDLSMFIIKTSTKADSLAARNKAFDFLVKKMDTKVKEWFDNVPNNLKFRIKNKKTHTFQAGTVTLAYYFLLVTIHSKNIHRYTPLEQNNDLIWKPKYFPSWGILFYATVMSYCILHKFRKQVLFLPTCKSFRSFYYISIAKPLIYFLSSKKYLENNLYSSSINEVTAGFLDLIRPISNNSNTGSGIKEVFVVLERLFNERQCQIDLVNILGEGIKERKLMKHKEEERDDNLKTEKNLDLNFDVELDTGLDPRDLFSFNILDIDEKSINTNSKPGKMSITSLVSDSDSIIHNLILDNAEDLMNKLKNNWIPDVSTSI